MRHQAAYDAVYEQIRMLPGDGLVNMPAVQLNALIWRCVHAALDAEDRSR